MKEQYTYNSYPLGKIPQEFMRPELEQVRAKGYDWKDARDIVDIWEKKVAKFAGSKYAVSVDCCSHGIFLALKYLQHCNELSKKSIITIPSRTYVSVPMQIKHAGLMVKFEDIEWSGLYQLKGSRIYDSAVRWTKNMYVGNDALQVISMQLKKRIPIGKGGIILCDDEYAYKWLKLASYDGRDLTTAYTSKDHVLFCGYHMYATPEDCARGILLMDSIPEVNEDSGSHLNYTDVSQIRYL